MARPKRDSAAQVMRRLQYDPLKFLVERANKMKDDDPKKLDLSLELLPYAYGKLRSIEHTVGEDQSVTITIGGQQPNQVKDVSDAHQPITVDAEVQPAAPAMRPT